MITIVYALVGIPLMFLYLSNMGNFMAESFRIFYQKVSTAGLSVAVSTNIISMYFNRQF